MIAGFNDPIKVDGFDELQRQIKKLPDSLKRTELIRIQKKVAKPLVEKTKLTAPEGPTGNLVDSIGTVTGRSKKNPNIYVVPRVKGRFKRKGRHANFVHEGTAFRRKKGGAPTGSMPKNAFMQRAYDATKSGLIRNYEKDIAKYIQRRINKLSK